MRLLDPSATSRYIFVLYYRIGDSHVRLKMVRKGIRQMEDRQRLVVDKSDGTSFADFDCQYLYNKPGVVDEKLDQIACVFATNGPFIYKVIYERNFYAGLIFKDRQRYEIFADNYPIKVAMNQRYFAVLTRRALNERPRILVYRDVAQNGSKYLYCGLKLDNYTETQAALTHLQAKYISMQITEDHVLVITTNKGQSVVKRFQLGDLEVQVNDVKNVDGDLVFNEYTEYPASHIPFNYIFVHRSLQKGDPNMIGGTLLGWCTLLGFILGTLFIGYLIKKDINATKKKIMDSGVDYSKAVRDPDDEEVNNLDISETFQPDDLMM